MGERGSSASFPCPCWASRSRAALTLIRRPLPSRTSPELLLTQCAIAAPGGGAWRGWEGHSRLISADGCGLHALTLQMYRRNKRVFQESSFDRHFTFGHRVNSQDARLALSSAVLLFTHYGMKL